LRALGLCLRDVQEIRENVLGPDGFLCLGHLAMNAFFGGVDCDLYDLKRVSTSNEKGKTRDVLVPAAQCKQEPMQTELFRLLQSPDETHTFLGGRL
jgi:hypothetical protein